MRKLGPTLEERLERLTTAFSDGDVPEWARQQETGEMLGGGQFWKQEEFPYMSRYVVPVGIKGDDKDWIMTGDPRTQGNVACTSEDHDDPLWTEKDLIAHFTRCHYTCQGQLHGIWLEEAYGDGSISDLRHKVALAEARKQKWRKMANHFGKEYALLRAQLDEDGGYHAKAHIQDHEEIREQQDVIDAMGKELQEMADARRMDLRVAQSSLHGLIEVARELSLDDETVELHDVVKAVTDLRESANEAARQCFTAEEILDARIKDLDDLREQLRETSRITRESIRRRETEIRRLTDALRAYEEIKWKVVYDALTYAVLACNEKGDPERAVPYGKARDVVRPLALADMGESDD